MKNRILLIALALILPMSLVAIGCPVPVEPVPAEFPTRDIRMICPWGAGGGADGITRKTAFLSEEHLGVDIFVENITGGASGIGVMEVMAASPDGYTIGTMTYDSIVTVPLKELVPGYDLERLVFIARMTTESRGVVVRADAPWETLEDLIEDARRRPGEILVAVDGIGTGSHLGFLMWEDAAGIELKHIPYPGGAGEQIEALLAGEVDIVGSTGFGDYFGIIDAGKARGLAIFAPARLPKHPDVPTLIELGYDVVHGSFIVVAAPAGTPPEVVQTLERAFYLAHHSAEFREWLDAVGVEASWLDSQATTRWVMEFQRGEFELIERLEAEGLL